MKAFGKWSITLIWFIIIIILVLALVFLAIPYQGYFWEGKGLPVNSNEIKSFDGNGYQLISEFGINYLLRLVSSGTFIWGYSNFISLGPNGTAIDLKEWLTNPNNVSSEGVINWPPNYELEAGTNFAVVIGSILTVLLVAIPVLILIGLYVTKKMIKAMYRPYSIEYLDARKKLQKTTKQAKKAVRKMTKAVRKHKVTQSTLAQEQERWANLIVAAKTEFVKEKDLFKAQYSRKRSTPKLATINGK